MKRAQIKPNAHISKAMLLAGFILAFPIIATAGTGDMSGNGQSFLPFIVAPLPKVPIDSLWQEFYFREAGTPAEGCATIGGCVPSPSGNSEFAPAAPWRFTAAAEGATLTVVDVADSGDVFSIFDFGTLIGTTSQVQSNDFFCGFDPEICLNDPNMSSGTFALGTGPHEITIIPIQSPFNAGTGYFRITSKALTVLEFEIVVQRGRGLDCYNGILFHSGLGSDENTESPGC